VIASGYVNIQKKQNLNSVNDAGKLSPSDLIFTPISEEEAKAKANSFKTGDGFTFFHSTGDEVVPYCNLESVRNIWGTGSIKTVSLESFVQLHVATGTLFFTLKCGSLVDEILKNEWRPGEYIVGL
jgi:hypothetical protein